MTDAPPLLQISDLRVEIRQNGRVGYPVDGVSYDLAQRETLGIVGESGSGKSLHILGVLGLLPRVACVSSGTVLFNGRDMLAVSAKQRRDILGKEIGIVFQDPMTSLNPLLTIGEQVGEVLARHLSMRPKAARTRAAELLDLVEIREPHRRLDQYPHELSGGMRQRVMIAIALACEPKLLIADEATTALDVTVQSQVVDLIMGLKKRLGMAVIWISHDMGVIARLSDTVQVMYGGQIMERGPVGSVFEAPQSAYTWSLMKSIPRADQTSREALFQIQGSPPDLFARPSGDPFAPRNPFATSRCQAERPVLRDVDGRPGHRVAAWYDLQAELAKQGAK